MVPESSRPQPWHATPVPLTSCLTKLKATQDFILGSSQCLMSQALWEAGLPNPLTLQASRPHWGHPGTQRHPEANNLRLNTTSFATKRSNLSHCWIVTGSADDFPKSSCNQGQVRALASTRRDCPPHSPRKRTMPCSPESFHGTA